VTTTAKTLGRKPNHRLFLLSSLIIAHGYVIASAFP
jgi:hypothetical protein